jgi:predicted peptidase
MPRLDLICFSKYLTAILISLWLTACGGSSGDTSTEPVANNILTSSIPVVSSSQAASSEMVMVEAEQDTPLEVAAVTACSPAVAPVANTLTLRAKGTTCATLGYAEYVPSAYATQSDWPLIISLNGNGQTGTGNATDIQKIDDDGLPKLVKAGTWDINKRFVVLAPQMDWQTRTGAKVNEFIQYAKANYKIDPARIYLTGLSGGGGPLFSYLENYSGGDIAALVPTSTLYSFAAAPAPCMWKAVPTWLFFGENDSTAQVFSHATAPFDGLKACSPAAAVTPRLTVYTGVAHDAWTGTFSLAAMNSAIVTGRDAYNQNIYDWMLQYKKTLAVTSSSSVSSSRASSIVSSLASSSLTVITSSTRSSVTSSLALASSVATITSSIAPSSRSSFGSTSNSSALGLSSSRSSSVLSSSSKSSSAVSSSSTSSSLLSSSRSSLSSAASSSLANACSPAIAPVANTLTLRATGTTCATLGYAEYVPAAYASQSGWPLIIALNGNGQTGTGNAVDIQKIDDDGLPKLINAGTWDTNKRFVVLAPQMNWETRTGAKVNEFIQFAKANYKIDSSRIYLTGLSGGGGPLFSYLENYSGGEVAALVPISTVYSFSGAPAPCMWKAVPTWLFFGENDGSAQVFSNATAPFDGLKTCSPAPIVTPRLTVFTGVGHDAWTSTLNLSAMNSAVVTGRYPYNQSVYDWMLQYTKPSPVISSSSVPSSRASSVASSRSSSSAIANSSVRSSLASSAQSLASLGSNSLGLTKVDPEFGTLTLLEKFDPSAPGLRETQIEPIGTNTSQTILGRTALVLTPQNVAGDMKASYAAFNIGKNKGLVAGKDYVLEVDYPDDVPRTIAILNRGADLVRTVVTGKDIGDYREQYAYPNPESLAYPQSNSWQTYRFYFTLHDRFQPLAGARNEVDTKRPFGPADGFWVAVGNFNPKGSPLNQGAAVGEFRLYSVNNAAAATLAINYPPAGVPHRRTFWREEMGDSPSICARGDSIVNTDPTSPTYATGATCNPATGTSPGTTTSSWFEYKMRLSKVLGFNVFTKDLLEFGLNQGIDTSGYGGGAWITGTRVAYWPEVTQKANSYGLEVMPYFEYYGALGGGTFTTTNCPSVNVTGDNMCAAAFGGDSAYQCKMPWAATQAKCFLPSYGAQKSCEPLTRAEKRYTGFGWIEVRGCLDVTDPKALEDVKKLLNANILDLKAGANFAGAWFRSRVGSWPISFSEATRARYAADRGIATPTKADLRASSTMRADYHSWWEAKRRDYLLAIRNYLRTGKNGDDGIDNASVLFTSYHEEGLPIPTPGYQDTNVVTDDTSTWSTITNDERWKYRFASISSLAWLTNTRYAKTLSYWLLPTEAEFMGTGEFDEFAHGTPPADPENYQSDEGVLMTMPFGRQYTLADTNLLQKFSTSNGMALVRHFPLNEDDGKGNYDIDSTDGHFNNWPMSGHFGYFVSDTERSTPYTMLAEVKGVANADPFWIGYLSSNSFNTGAPQDLRRFNAAYLAWPAQLSTKVLTASSDPEVIVRDMVTSGGKFVAIFNTGMAAKTAVQITLSTTRMGAVTSLQDRVSGQTLAVTNGKITLDMPVADFRVFYVP